MADKKQELQLRKEEAPMESEPTRNRRVFTPAVDIIEREDAIVVTADMPGVDDKNVDISLEKSVLTIAGKIEPEHYADHRISYAEYDVGDYRRSFTLSDMIDQTKIEAVMNQGALTLTLPKAEPAKLKKIQVKSL